MKQKIFSKRTLSFAIAFFMIMSMVMVRPAVVKADSSLTTVSTEAAAISYLRSQMKNRQTTIKFYYTGEGYSGILNNIMTQAQKHTGVADEGDYIAWHINKISGSAEWTDNKYLITYNATYYTTKSEEDAVTSKLNTVMNSLNLSGKGDYDKVKAIYDYITANVTYDTANVGKPPETERLHFSAYAALIKGTSVCQGYANLFYRMALTAGLDARFIKGYAYDPTTNEQLGHGWNIVKVEGKYYYLDSTWDSYNTPSTYKYFLKGSTNMLKDHTLDSNYTSEYNQYNISTTDYVKPANVPTNVSVALINQSAAQVKWTLPTGATSPEVYMSTSQNGNYTLAGTFSGTSGNVSGLELGKTYYFKVCATLSNGTKSGFSSVVSIRSVPKAPYNVKATTVDYTSIKLNWTADSRVQFVEVWRTHKANAVQSEYVQLGIYYADAGTSMSRSLTPGKTYYYKFRGYSYDSNNKKVFSGYSAVVKATAKALAAPSNVKATRASSTSVKLEWKASSDAQFVEVWRTHKANAVQSEYVQLGIYYADAGTSMSRSLTTGKTYYYKFRAYTYDENNKKIFSGYSSIVNATP